MITFQSASLRRGSRLLFDSANLTIYQGEKVGVVGMNGCGKSSLFQLLTGELDTDDGKLSLPAEQQIAISRQSGPPASRAIIDYVLDGHQHYRLWHQRHLNAIEADDYAAITDAASQLDQMQSWLIEAKSRQLLSGLGFHSSQFDRPAGEFSGGWQMRLNLAQTLITPADILLLDEPTNHLDLDAILWLESWLVSYPGTLLLISHDRVFLDRLVDRILHFNNQQLRLYSGNYSAFEHQLAERIRLETSQQKAIQRQQKQLQGFIDRFRAKASKAKQAQSRIKQLQKLEDVSVTQIRNPYRFNFRTLTNPPDPIVRLENLCVGYQQQPIVKDINWIIQAGDRIGLLGANGSGKSTLLKTIVAKQPPMAGERWISDKGQIGYFDQHQLNQLDPESTVFNVVQGQFTDHSEQQIKDYLGGYGFRGEQLDARCKQLSGGEKSRLVLAMLMNQDLNLLILDEPTNHLDLQAREALTLAIQSFEGALIVVSHDRHLLESSCDQFYLIQSNRLTPFDGTVEDYRLQLINQQSPETEQPSSTDRKTQRQRGAQLRKQLAPLKKNLQQLENKLQQLTDQLDDIENQLSHSDIYEASAKEQLKTLLKEQAEARSQQLNIEADYLEAVDALDQAEQELNELD